MFTQAPVESVIDLITELLGPEMKGWYSLSTSRCSKASFAGGRVREREKHAIYSLSTQGANLKVEAFT